MKHQAINKLKHDKDTYEFCRAHTENENPDIPILSKMCSSTLDDIEKAVIDLFSSYDCNRVTMKLVAIEANVSLQTIYKYFGNKQMLICTIVNRVLERLSKRMIDSLYGIDSIKERLRKTLWVCFDFVDNYPKVIMVISTAVPASHYRSIAIYENKELIEAFLALLADGQSSGILNDRVPLYVLHDMFMGFISRLGFMHIIRGKSTPINEQFNALFDILWRGLAKH